MKELHQAGFTTTPNLKGSMPQRYCNRKDPGGCHSFFEYMGRINPEEIIGILGVNLMIPQSYLWGTQQISEFTGKSREIAETRFNKCGTDCLENIPALCCALFYPETNQAQIAVIDAHNRIRYAPLHGIRKIPCIVLDIKETLLIMEAETSEEKLKRMIEIKIAESLKSFQTMSEHKQPSSIYDVSNMDGLVSKFPSFDPTGSVFYQPPTIIFNEPGQNTLV